MAAQAGKGPRLGAVPQGAAPFAMRAPPFACAAPLHLLSPPPARCGAVAEWSKAHAWKVCMGQKLIEGSNPSRSATYSIISMS